MPTLDFVEYGEAVQFYLRNPVPGVDIYTAAARKVSGVPDLVLTKEQRRQCKQASFFIVYGGTPESFMGALKR